MKLFDIKLSEIQQNQFTRYYELLIEWNQHINLTAITDYDEVMMKHFRDSLCISDAIDVKTVSNLIDIGTGAGFPGIPIKILYPDIEVTLLDSLQKRVNFLNVVIEELGLSGITAVHGRAEDIARDVAYREKYDLCVSRAVANLTSLCELCIPFVKVGGNFVSYKAEKAEEELSVAGYAIEELGGGNVKSVPSILPGTDYSRKLIVIEKISATADKYPRKAGTPIKKPLVK